MVYDLIVIGGGANGCGIVRDAAMRGLKTILLEKNDLGSGTTGASSQMIHGGARYLFSSLKTTRESSLDSGYIQKIAPHLLFRIPFLIPIPKGRSGWLSKMQMELMEAFLENYDRYGKLKNGKRHVRLNREEALSLEPDLSEEIVGALSFDEWGIDTFRLCVANAVSARQHGAAIRNHSAVTRVLKEGGRVVGVRGRDEITGETLEFRGRWVVNATGPWGPRLAAMAGVPLKLRPSKGVHVSLDRRFSNYAVLSQAIDGRSIFVMPYQNISFLGTTDDDYFGDPDDIPILEDEVEYLLEGIERVLPRIRQIRRTHAWAGVRPTLYQRGPNEEDLSRNYRVFDHESLDGVPGFISLAGGKLASYRLMSEKTVDLVMEKLGREGECRTHLVPLPGGERRVQATDLAKQFKVPLFAAQRLVYRYGGRAYEVLELTRENRSSANILCSCDPVTEAELRFAVRREWARTLEDLKRRTRLSLGPCQGTRCFMLGAQILGEELNWKAAAVHREIKNAIEKRWKEKLPVLHGTGLQEEELLGQIYYETGHLNK